MSRFPDWLSPVALLNAVAGSRKVAETTGIAFGSGNRDRLDVYAPRRARSGAAPVVVFFYGGGWESGDRAMYRFVGTALAAEGIVTVVPDYRVFPDAHFPAFVEDGARTVKWVSETIGAFGGDSGKIVLAGHSAGAHIAAMLALDPQWLRGAGVDARRCLRGLVGLSGPYDFLPLHSAVLEQIFGPEPGRAASQPINFAGAGGPAALLITGGRDRVVDPGNTTRLAARLRSAGAEVETITYPRLGHAEVVGAFGRPLRLLAPVLAETVAFVRRVTAAETADAPALQPAR